MTAPTSTLTVLVYDLVIPQGSDWPGVDFPILNQFNAPADLTGYSAHGQIRPFRASAELYYTWSTSPTAGQGTITLDVGASTLNIRVLAAESAMWAFTEGVYDILLTNPSAPVGTRITRVVMGSVTVSPEVTL